MQTQWAKGFREAVRGYTDTKQAELAAEVAKASAENGEAAASLEAEAEARAIEGEIQATEAEVRSENAQALVKASEARAEGDAEASGAVSARTAESGEAKVISEKRAEGASPASEGAKFAEPSENVSVALGKANASAVDTVNTDVASTGKPVTVEGGEAKRYASPSESVSDALAVGGGKQNTAKGIDNSANEIYNNSNTNANGISGGETEYGTGTDDEFGRVQEECRRLSDEDVELFHRGSRRIDEGVRSRLSDVFARRLEAERSRLRYDTQLLNNAKTGETVAIFKNVEANTFHDIFEIVQKYLKNGDAVDVHDVNGEYGYSENTNYLSSTGLSGFSITPTGDLVSVFSLGEKGFLRTIRDYVKSEGAVTLDCYQSEVQPLADMYSKTLGFKTASLLDFNYEILAEDKGKNYADMFVSIYGEAPVAFMVNTDSDIEVKHFDKNQYDEAVAYRDSYVENTGENLANTGENLANAGETRAEPTATVEEALNRSKEKKAAEGVVKKKSSIWNPIARFFRSGTTAVDVDSDGMERKTGINDSPTFLITGKDRDVIREKAKSLGVRVSYMDDSTAYTSGKNVKGSAGASGRDVRIFLDNIRREVKARAEANGEVLSEKELNARIASEAVRVTYHEFGHIMEVYAKEAFADFKALAKERYIKKHGEEGFKRAWEELNKNEGRELSEGEVESELACDMIPELLEDKKFLSLFEKQMNRDKKLFGKFLNAVGELLSRVRSFFESLGFTKRTDDEVALRNLYIGLRQSFNRASAEYNRQKRKGTVAGTIVVDEKTGEVLRRNEESEGVKYKKGKKSVEGEITLSDVKEIRSIGKKHISKFTSEDIKKAEPFAREFFNRLGIKSPFFRAWFGDWREFDKNKKISIADIPEYIDDNEERKKQRGMVRNSDTEWNIRISRDGESNTISHSGAGRLSEKGLAGIRQLVENAVLLDTEVHEHHSNNAKNDLIFFDHKMYSLGKDNSGKIGLYKITVEERYQDAYHTNEKRFHNLLYIEKVAEVPADANADKDRKDGSTNGTSTTTYSIADLFSFVKTYDKEFRYNSVNPSMLNKDDGTPKILYHGTDAEFESFDPTKGRANMDIQGMFFSPWEIDAAGYGSKVGAYYLNLKNPADGRTAYKALNMFKGQNYAGAKAREYLIKQGYDGVNNNDEEYIAFYPEQVKSATDNIGTFDGEDKRYKYSTVDTRKLGEEFDGEKTEGAVADGVTDGVTDDGEGLNADGMGDAEGGDEVGDGERILPEYNSRGQKVSKFAETVADVGMRLNKAGRTEEGAGMVEAAKRIAENPVEYKTEPMSHEVTAKAAERAREKNISTTLLT